MSRKALVEPEARAGQLLRPLAPAPPERAGQAAPCENTRLRAPSWPPISEPIHASSRSRERRYARISGSEEWSSSGRSPVHAVCPGFSSNTSTGKSKTSLDWDPGTPLRCRRRAKFEDHLDGVAGLGWVAEARRSSARPAHTKSSSAVGCINYSAAIRIGGAGAAAASSIIHSRKSFRPRLGGEPGRIRWKRAGVSVKPKGATRRPAAMSLAT